MTKQTTWIVSLVMTLAIAAAIAVPATTFAQPLTEEEVGITAIEEGGLRLGGGDVRQTVARLINVALGFLGIIAVIIVLLGGFKYMLSGGNEEKTSEARKLIVSGIIGLAIILSAWAITSFVVSQLLEATSST